MLTRSEYWSEIHSIAAELRREAKAHDMDRDDAERWLCETLDSHEFAIYTGRAMLVLFHSDTDESAYFDAGGSTADWGDSIPWSALAYHAMEADVRARLDADGFDWDSPAGE